MTERYQTSYDELPYVSQAFAQTHPDRLAVLAKLFGIVPPPLEHCRVLELGCASGGNLIPMAEQMPEASFLGVDLSARQVGDGQAMIQELGLSNVELKQMDIADIGPAMGQFDYIIAHGVYSWVPEEVQGKILTVCNENLAPNGVAYVSYNTNPGWRMRGMIRDMMLYHAAPFGETSVKVRQARALLDFLAQNVSTDNNPYGILLKQELEALRDQDDSYLAHDHLEQVNEPIYFHQFAERAAQHGLQYLGEAEFHTMLASNFSPKVSQTLRMISSDIIRMEQYMDFLRNRIFRQSLLVHREAPLNRNLDWRSVQGFYVASQAQSTTSTPSDLHSPAVEQFRVPSGATLSTTNPIVKAAMTILAERWPQAILFSDLCTAARSRLGNQPSAPPVAAADAQALGTDLLQCYAGGVVELRLRAPRFVMAASNMPIASPVARFLAEKGLRVTNLRHERVNLDHFNRQVLRQLNGQRDRAALLEVLTQLVGQGELAIQREGQPVHETAAVREILTQALNENLPKIARAALLVA